MSYYRIQSIQREIKEVFAKVSIGATGAPTLVSGEASQGISSITRTSAGLYRVIFSNQYAEFICANPQVLSSVSQGLNAQIKAEDVSASSPYIDIEFQTNDGGLASAIVLANELKTNYTAHIADTAQHTTGADSTNVISAADASNLSSLITLVTELLTDYDVHEDDSELASGWAYHAAQETADASPASTTAPTNLAECIENLDDLKAKFNIHDADATSHAVQNSYQIVASNSYAAVATDPESGSILYIEFKLKNSPFRS